MPVGIDMQKDDIRRTRTVCGKCGSSAVNNDYVPGYGMSGLSCLMCGNVMGSKWGFVDKLIASRGNSTAEEGSHKPNAAGSTPAPASNNNAPPMRGELPMSHEATKKERDKMDEQPKKKKGGRVLHVCDNCERPNMMCQRGENGYLCGSCRYAITNKPEDQRVALLLDARERLHGKPKMVANVSRGRQLQSRQPSIEAPGNRPKPTPNPPVPHSRRGVTKAELDDYLNKKLTPHDTVAPAPIIQIPILTERDHRVYETIRSGAERYRRTIENQVMFLLEEVLELQNASVL